MGLITNIDANGRIQLPLAIRYGLNLCSGDKIVVDQLGDGTIILKKIDFQNEQDKTVCSEKIRSHLPQIA